MNDSMNVCEIQNVLAWLEDGNVCQMSAKDVENVIVSLFRLRDCRDISVRVGRRSEFYDAFLRLYVYFPDTMTTCLPLISVYGYYKDFMNMLIYAKERSLPVSESLKSKIYDELARTMLRDVSILEKVSRHEGVPREVTEILDAVHTRVAVDTQERMSLCSKWMPRENGRADRIIGNVVRDISERMFPDVVSVGERCRLYRKVCRIYSVMTEGSRRSLYRHLFVVQIPSITTATRLWYMGEQSVSSPYSFDSRPIVWAVGKVEMPVFTLNPDSLRYEDWLERRWCGVAESLDEEQPDVVESSEIAEDTPPTEQSITQRLLSVFWG